MNLYYCNQCGMRIPQADLDAGSVQPPDNGAPVLCMACSPARRTATAPLAASAPRSTGVLLRTRLSSSNLPPARKTTTQLPSPADTSKARAGNVRRVQAGPSGPPKALIVAGLSVVGVGVLAGLLFMGRGAAPKESAAHEESKTGANPTSTGPSRPEPPPELPAQTTSNGNPPPGPGNTGNEAYNPRAWMATSLLEEAKTFASKHPKDGYAYRDKLQSIVDRYAGTPAADEATKLLSTLVLPRDDRLPKEDAWADSVDLIGLLSPKGAALQGSYTLKNGLLTCKSGPRDWLRLQVPYCPPKEYDLKLSFKRLSGDECLTVGLSNQGHPFCFMISGWKNTKAGFENIKGERIPESRYALTQPDLLTTGRKYELILQVRSNALRAFLNGQHLVSADAFPDDLSEPPNWPFPYSGDRGLGLGCIAPYEIYEMRLLPVTGEGKAINRSALTPSGGKNTTPPAPEAPVAASEPTPTPPPTPAEPSAAHFNVVLEFNFGSGNTMGWRPSRGLNAFSFKDGALATSTTQADAYMELGGLKLDTRLVTHLALRLKADKAGDTQVYFVTSKGARMEQNDVGIVRTQGDQQWHDYTVQLTGLKGFDGELRTLRLDPVNGDTSVGAQVELKWIRLVHTRE